MANKLKLVFLLQNLNDTKTWLKNNSTGKPDWNNSLNDFYRSVVFTQDGHLLTHGVDFNPVASLGAGLLFNPTAGTTSASNPGTVNNAIPVFNKQSNSLTVSWVNRSTFVEYPSGGFTTGAVLIGNGTNTPTTKLIDSTVTAGSLNLITSGAVKTAIAEAFAANDAMLFAGTYEGAITPPVEGEDVVSGNFMTTPGIRLGRGCTWRVSSSGFFGLDQVEVGDLIIAIHDSVSATDDDDPSKYTIILTNIDGALTTANLNGNNGTGNFIDKRAVYKDADQNLYINLVFRKILTNNDDVIESTNLNPLWFTAGNSLYVELGVGATKNTITYGIADIVKAQETQGLYKIKHNALGLITGSAAWTPNSLTFKEVAFNYDSYDGGSDKTYNPNGTSLSLLCDRGIIFWQEKSDKPILIGHSSIGATTVTALTGQYISGLVIDSYGHVTGVTTDNDINTWRPVNAYLLSNGSTSASLLSSTPSSVGTADLTFGSEFVFAGTETVGSETGNEIHLVWAEVASDGTITYAV